MAAPTDAIRAVLELEPGLQLAVLFGSAARGSAHRGSDVDVGVQFEHGTAADSLGALGVRLDRATGGSIDLVLLNTAPPLLRFEIARDGMVLLERVPHAWSTFRTRAMLDWWDWAPTARMMYAVAAERVRSGADAPPACEDVPRGSA